MENPSPTPLDYYSPEPPAPLRTIALGAAFGFAAGFVILFICLVNTPCPVLWAIGFPFTDLLMTHLSRFSSDEGLGFLLAFASPLQFAAYGALLAIADHRKCLRRTAIVLGVAHLAVAALAVAFWYSLYGT